MQPTSDTIRVFLLGKFEIHRADKRIRARDWTRRKAAALLQRLAHERRLVKDQAIEFLWPERDPAAGANNLYRTLYALRQTLNTFLGADTADEVLFFKDGVLRLNDSVWVDVAEFRRLCEPDPYAPAAQQFAKLKVARALYQGDLLPDERYEEWTIRPRETLAQLFRKSSLTLAQHHREQADYASAIDQLTGLLARDPADDPVHRELMEIYALAGRRHDALRQYQTCVEAVASELDAAPDPETTALYERILSGELAPQRVSPTESLWAQEAVLAPPPPVSLDANRTNLLAGRQSELKTLSSMLQEAQNGRGATVLIAGETGIGKTHLAMEGLKQAAASGMTTLMGAAYEQEGRLAFQPFLEAIDHFLAEQGRSRQENPISHHQRLHSSDPQQEHWALFQATANFLQKTAQRAPLVFLVDDLHAADETSLQLFHYLARQTRAAPVLFIATYRVDAPPSTHFNTLISGLYREGLSETIALDALPHEAVGAILKDILKGEISEALCRAVYDITAGNPFFTQEIAWSLRKRDKLHRRDGLWSLKAEERLDVPDNLGVLLRQKVARLGRDVERALMAAAVLGREFRFGILSDITALSGGELLDALDAALAGHLVEEIPAGYRFRHPLIRRTLYESLSQIRRANLHTVAAETIEAAATKRSGEGRCPAGADELAAQAETLAYHFDLSTCRERALPYLIQAGENAANVYAFEVAIDYFERALLLMNELGMADPARRWHVLESLGCWHGSILADTPQAVACFEEALALQPTPDWTPASQDIIRLHCGAAVALITAGNMDGAEAHLQTALGKIDEAVDAPEHADLLYNLAQLHWHRNEYQQAMDVAQRSLAIAEHLDKPDAIARAFEMLALACHSMGEWQTGMAYEQQRAELAGAGLDVTDAFDAHL